MNPYQETLSPAEELLVLAVKDGRTSVELKRVRSLYEQLGDEAVVKIATDNKLVPMVAHGLMDALPTAEVPASWVTLHAQSQEKVNAFFEELDRLAIVFERQGAPIVIIENGGVARGVYPCRGCFASSDVEILVDKEQLPVIDHILASEGYERHSRERCASENPQQWDREIRGWNNFCKTLDSGVVFWLNVQWRPVLRRWLPMESGLTSKGLIARSVPVNGAGSGVRILSPEDNLLLCALHTASHSYVRGPGVRLQLDIDRLVRRVSIDWDVFLDCARRCQAASLVFPSLAIPQGLLGTPIPEYVLAALMPSASQAARVLDRIAQASVFNRSLHKFNSLQLVALELELSDQGVLGSFRRVFVPPAEWMREGYRLRGNPPLIYCHLERLTDLARRRFV